MAKWPSGNPASAGLGLSRRSFVGLLGMAVGLRGQRGLAHAPTAPQGTSSAQAQRLAQKRLAQCPLPPQAALKVRSVLRRVALFRRTPVQTVLCELPLFEFLVLHPDMMVGLWRVLGISRVRLVRTGPGRFQADDGAGTRSTVEFLHTDRGYLLAYAQGGYEGPLVPRPLRGGCLLQLQYHPVPKTQHPTILTRMDLFVRIDNLAADLLTRAFRSTVGRMTDLNYTETMAFVGQLYQVARRRPELVEDMALRCSQVAPQDRRRFVQLVYRIAGSAGEAREVVQRPRVPLSRPRFHSWLHLGLRTPQLRR